MPRRTAGIRTLAAGVCLLGVVVLSPAVPRAQQAATPADQPIFRTSATLVTVDAVVTDRDGRHVKDLTAADFEIIEDGTRRQVRQVAYVPLVSGYATAADVGAEPRAPGARPSQDASSRIQPLSRAVAARPERIARTIAVVVDDLGLSFESTANVRNALRRFVDEQVQPGDLVAILRTSGGIGALQQFTTDKRLLHAAVDRVQWTVLSRSGVAAFSPVVPADYEASPSDPTRQGYEGTRPIGGQAAEVGAAYGEDSLETLRGNVLTAGTLGALEFVVRGVQNLPGRKAVVFISEGFDLFNRKGQSQVFSAFTRLMDRANRAGVVVYTMDGRGLEAGGLTADDNPRPPVTMGPGGGPTQDQLLREIVLGARYQREAIVRNTEEALHYLAWQTGGFAILNNNDMAGGLGRVLEDLQGYYLIGFDAPEDLPRGWDPGRVVVRVKRPRLRVRSRQGFFGPADPGETPEPVGDALTLAALSPFAAGDITLRLTSLFGHDRTAGPYVRSLLFIDANQLQFTPGDEGRHE
ncbi:MAG TPA: VWA domain-containing protein, partial [Methylomirabilota bacterium]